MIQVLIFCAAFCVAADAQKGADAINQQIRSLGESKAITLSVENGTSKLMAKAEAFDAKDTRKTGAEAISFGMAAYFPGASMTAAPDTVNFTFWVLTKKPRFANSHHWIAKLDDGQLDLGDARYASKPGEEMEYLNFKLSRNDLERIASTARSFRIGDFDMSFTPSQLKLIRDLITISRP